MLLVLLACKSIPLETGEPPDETDVVETDADTDADTDSDTGPDTDSPCDPLIFWSDADADGFGDPASAIESCDQPPGTVTNGEDCDDADATVHPGAEERCDDGRDQDCSGLSNDDAVDRLACYPDADGDGWGD